jgi:hypothetical protein
MTTFDIESVLADEKLTRLRRAYHQLEAFQLSGRHLSLKMKFEQLLSKPARQEPPVES